MQRKIAVIGLGYVGLPLAVAFGKTQQVIGFDINKERVKSLQEGCDRTGEVSTKDLSSAKILFTSEERDLKTADFFIVCVPTPIDDNKNPVLKFLRSASEVVGRNISSGAIVVFESTVYPGATEEICLPIIEDVSGLQEGVQWFLAYSPERINPGDKEHTIEKVIKVVSASNLETLKIVSEVYRKICHAGVFEASTIRVAEAAKIIENVQRDLNIALMNELSIIFDYLDISTPDVLAAANTKWNFHKYTPGLVGGHCIGVDPYYLTYKSRVEGYDPQIILAGRKINDSMHEEVLRRCMIILNKHGKPVKGSKILVLGASFKENVADFRNSRVQLLIKELLLLGSDVFLLDPYLNEESKTLFDVNFVQNFNDIPDKSLDFIILATPHRVFKTFLPDKLLQKMRLPLFFDIKSAFSRSAFRDAGFAYFSL